MQPALAAEHLAGPCIEQGEGVVDLGDGPDGTATGLPPVGLADGDGRGDSRDLVSIGLVELIEKLARIR